MMKMIVLVAGLVVAMPPTAAFAREANTVVRRGPSLAAQPERSTSRLERDGTASIALAPPARRSCAAGSCRVGYATLIRGDY